MSKPVWTDNHCHLDLESAEQQLADAKNSGVQRLIAIGTDLKSSREAIQIAEQHQEIWATAGIHPHDAKDNNSPESFLELEEMLKSEKAVAVGECGFDFYYMHSEKDVQREVFIQQIQLAHKYDLPLVIHSRNAWDETFEVLEGQGMPKSTIFHCFTGGVKEAQIISSLGGYISFSGILTFKNAPEVREAAAACALNSVLVETDAPFLSPEPHRGKTNVPANLVLVGMELSRVMGVSFEELAKHTWDNTSRAYGL